jgi:hypothetical protein
VVVAGPSASGKSSLLTAGLIASMRDAGLHGLRRPRELIMSPGSEPWTALARCLARLASEEPASLRARLAEDPTRLDLVFRGQQYGQDERPVLVVDQFEELFTACSEEAVRRGFIEALCLAARSGPAGAVAPAVVVLGVRTDFYGHCAAYPSLTAALERPVIVGPMTRRIFGSDRPGQGGHQCHASAKGRSQGAGLPAVGRDRGAVVAVEPPRVVAEVISRGIAAAI